MPRRSRAWIWAGRAVAAAAVIGLAGYLYAAGLGKADELAGVIGVFLALAALVAPYLLPVPPQPVPPGGPVPPPGPGGDSIVIIADHGSVAARKIHDVTMNGPRPDPRAPGGQAGP